MVGMLSLSPFYAEFFAKMNYGIKKDFNAVPLSLGRLTENDKLQQAVPRNSYLK